MDTSKKINRLAKRLIKVSTEKGELNESELWQGILQLKESGFKHLIPLLKALRPKVSQAVAWQTIEVTSPTVLSDSAIASLKNVFETKYNRPVQVRTKLDPALIGGLQVRIGDDVYDASVSAHLKRIAGEI
ncbi:MAG: F0F1 ATP synthase subunit delta [Verrucomicrobia bacterium]|jgi:F-type H+-transporting ATPase subunit delta|nr:F0F1 ATP synthase subunit delta [Verrucomicrobiota bacterium]